MNLSLSFALSSRSYIRTGVDPDLAAFIAATGATNTDSLSNLVTYLKAENLWTSSRIYPMRSDQNKGSGATVFGLGGLTSNNMTLVSSPTWGAAGISYDGINQYGTIADFLGSSTLTVFNRLSHGTAPPASTIRLYGQGDTLLNTGSFTVSYAGDAAGTPYRIYRTSNGQGVGSGAAEIYAAANEAQTTASQTLVNQWINGGGRSMWQNKTSLELTLLTGTAQTSKFNTTDPFIYSAVFDNGALLQPSNQTGTCLAAIEGTITDTQRETITDLINALGSTGDSDLDAYVAASGATDTEPLLNLVTYLKQQSLWTSSRIYPMKAAQNAGSGSVVYGLGGLTANNLSLVNSPAWGASDIDFTVVNSYGVASIPAFNNLTEGLVITRFKPADAATTDGANKTRWFYGLIADSKYLGSATSTSAISNETYTTYQSTPEINGRTGSSTASWAANEDFTEVCKFGTFPSSAAVYKNKTAFVMNQVFGPQTFTPASIGYTANSNVYLSTLNNQQVTQTGKFTAWGVIGAAVTTTQREAITDLINAL